MLVYHQLILIVRVKYNIDNAWEIQLVVVLGILKLSALHN